MNAFYEHREEKLFIGEMTHFPFPAHIHELVEIVALTAGSVLLNIDGIEYRLAPGDIAVIFPLTIHSYEELSDNVEGTAAIFPVDIIPEYSGTFHGLMPETPILRSGQTGPEARQTAMPRKELVISPAHAPREGLNSDNIVRVWP